MLPFTISVILLFFVCSVYTAVPSYDTTLSMDSLYYSKAVKCNSALIGNWSCGAPCKYHKMVTDVTVFENATWTTQGFSGYDASSNRIVIAFRGSTTTLNWIEDFDFTLVDYLEKSCSPNCQVHRGFYGAFDSLSHQIAQSLKMLLNLYPKAEMILVTGHSLGAAIAHLTALSIAEFYGDLSLPVYLYNFGQPRVGNAAYAAYASDLIRKTGGIIYRMTHHQDPVPKLPPEWVGYLHSPIEVYYPDNTATNFRVCDDSLKEDPQCCMGEASLNPADHNLYLGISANCD